MAFTEILDELRGHAKQVGKDELEVICTVVQVDKDRVDVVQLRYLPLVDAFSIGYRRPNNSQAVEPPPTRQLTGDDYAERATAVCNASFQSFFEGTRVVFFIGERREAQRLGVRLSAAFDAQFSCHVFTKSSTLPTSHEMDDMLVNQVAKINFALYAHLLAFEPSDTNNQVSYQFKPIKLFDGRGTFANGASLRDKGTRLVIGDPNHPFHLIVEIRLSQDNSVWLRYADVCANTELVRITPVVALDAPLGWRLHWEGVDQKDEQLDHSLEKIGRGETLPFQGSRQTITQKCVLVIEADMGMRELLTKSNEAETIPVNALTSRAMLKQLARGLVQVFANVRSDSRFVLLFYHDNHDGTLMAPPEFEARLAKPTLRWLPTEEGQPNLVTQDSVNKEIDDIGFDDYFDIAPEWYKPLEEAAYALSETPWVNAETTIIWVGQSPPHDVYDANRPTLSMPARYDFRYELNRLREKGASLISVFISGDVPQALAREARAVWREIAPINRFIETALTDQANVNSVTKSVEHILQGNKPRSNAVILRSSQHYAFEQLPTEATVLIMENP